MIDILFPAALAVVAILYSAVGQAGGTGYVALMGLALRANHHQADRAGAKRIGVGHWLRSVLSFGRSWPAVLIARRRATSLSISIPTGGRRIAAGSRRADGALRPGDRGSRPRRA
jgi:hypothetical protein